MAVKQKNKKIPARNVSANKAGRKKKTIKKPSLKKVTKKVVKGVVKKPKKQVIKKKTVKKTVIKKPKKKVSTLVDNKKIKKKPKKADWIHFKEISESLSKDVFGVYKTGRFFVREDSLIKGGAEKDKVYHRGMINSGGREGDLGQIEKIAKEESKEDFVQDKIDIAPLKESKNNDQENIEIEYDLSGLKKSPHLVDLREKNTNEIKGLIKKERRFFKTPTPKKNQPKADQSLAEKNSFRSLKFTKQEKKAKPKTVKVNFAKLEEIITEEHFQNKIGFLRTLFFPVYSLWVGLENFFIDLSSLTRGKIPWMFKFSFPLEWKRSFVFFLIVCFVLVLPFEAIFLYNANYHKKGKVLGETTTALEQLKLGGESVLSNDLEQANYYFSESLNNFHLAKEELQKTNSLVLKILQEVPFDEGRVLAGKNLISFGENISEAAVFLNKALEEILDKENGFNQDLITFNNREVKAINLGDDFFEKINKVQENVSQAKKKIQEAENNLSKINLDILPENDKDKLIKLKEFLPVFISSLQNFNGIMDFWLQFLGKDSFKRYLIVFQNNYELRATGGFIGSFALFDINKGKIKNIEFPEDGSYNLQGGLTKRISAPEPMYLVSPLWQFHDANWWPDFPSSAKKLMQFYELSGGPTVDGVIAITPEVLIELLKITGPIEMTEYNEIVTVENFMWVAEYNVELEYDKAENKPKKFLADLCVKIFDKLWSDSGDLKSSSGFANIFGSLDKIVKEKDLQLFFTDQKMQELIKKYSLSGEIKDTPLDYLMVVNTNIAGGKTDGVISQVIDLKTEVQEDGSVINNLTIKRTHNGDPKDYFQKARNLNWMRIYLPKGTELLSARGFDELEGKYFPKPEGELEIDSDLARLEGGFKVHDQSGTYIYDQFEKTILANWSMIDVGEEEVIEIEYKLPFKLDRKMYTILAQKQAGINSYFYHTLKAADNSEIIWTNKTKKEFSGILNTDKLFGYILK